MHQPNMKTKAISNEHPIIQQINLPFAEILLSTTHQEIATEFERRKYKRKKKKLNQNI
ncbi:hypothetical protein D3C78_1779010 [compost metagenome]